MDQRRLAALQKRMKDAGDKGLTRELSKGMKAAAEPIAAAERSAAQSLPASGSKSTGLRAAIASAVSIRYSRSKRNPGVRVYVPARKMPQGQGRLPRLMNKGAWRHPVYGNKNNWVEQKSDRGWWDDTAKKELPRVRRELAAAIERVTQKIGRGV